MAFLGSAPGGSRATDFGQQLGSSLGHGLSELANAKLSQLQQKQSEKEFRSIGYDPKTAKLFSMYRNDPQLLKLIQSYVSPYDEGEKPQKVDERNYLEAFQHPEQQQQQQIEQQDFDQVLQSLKNPIGFAQARMGQELLNQNQIPEKIQKHPEKQLSKPIQLTNKPLSRTPSFIKPLTTQQRLTAEANEQKRIDKETKPIYDEIIREGKVVDASEKRLNRMEQLIKKGDLPTALWYNFFSGLSEVGSGDTSIPIVGPIIGLLANPIGGLGLAAQRATSSDVEEFEKLSADFIKDAKNFFPGRITDADLKAFLKTIPTLSQTDEGKISIIQNMRSFNKASKIKENAAKQIVRENGGRRPDDFQELLDRRTEKQLDKIADEFIHRTKKPIKYNERERYLFGLLPKIPSATGF